MTDTALLNTVLIYLALGCLMVGYALAAFRWIREHETEIVAEEHELVVAIVIGLIWPVAVVTTIVQMIKSRRGDGRV